MKKVVILALLGLLWTTPRADAANQHTMSGCGLGYVLFGKEHPSDPVLQVLAATTNGLFANHLFGISSGTLGCTRDGLIAENIEAEVYAEVNFRSLLKEMAQGAGEHVHVFATLLGAGEAAQPKLLAFFREHYTNLIPSGETTPQEMVAHVRAALATHPDLRG
jgi:hypothetical protein